MKKRTIATFLTVAALSSLAVSGAKAEGYYEGKTVTMICPWSAGGGSDTCVRMMTTHLEEELGATITVINPTGGSGWVAWQQLLSSGDDGLTISQVNFPTLIPGYLDPSYERTETLDDFKLLANQVTDDCAVAINKDETRFTTMEELVEYAKENTVTFGTTGAGSDDSILMNLLNNKLGTMFVEIPSPGWSDNSAAIQGGHVDVVAGNVSEVYALLNEGEVNVLAVFAEETNELIPEVPTFDSLGICEESITNASRRGFAVNAGTNEEAVAELEAAMEKILTDDAVKEELYALGLKVDFMNSEEYTAVEKAEEETLISMADVFGWEIE